MRHASAAIVLVAFAALACYVLALQLIDYLPGLDVAQPLAVWWTGAWFLGAVFAAWNLWDSALDVRDAYRRQRSATIKAGGLWRLRSDLLQCAACCLMTMAGGLAIVQQAGADVRTALILAGGLSVIVNQAWNRIDRERVVRMPLVTFEARTLAVDLAAAARQMGHDVANKIVLPVGVLEELRARPGMRADELEDIDAAVEALLSLADHVSTLHRRIRQRDPSNRGMP